MYWSIITLLYYREDNAIQLEECSAYGKVQRLRDLESGLQEDELYERKKCVIDNSCCVVIVSVSFILLVKNLNY